MSRPRGGIIGKRVTPGASMSGIWTLREAQEQVAAQEWPPFYDANRASVSLLLHMDGANNSTTFTDSGPGARTVTANGNAKISTTQSKFGGASCYLDGNGDFLSLANNAAFDFGSGDLTIEAWVWIDANSVPDNDGFRTANIVNTWNTTGTIVGYNLIVMGNASSTGTGLGFDTWNSLNATLYRATVTVAQSAWHHIAVSVSGGTRRLYLNGTEASGSTTTIGSGYTQANSLGNAFRVGMTPFTGYPLPLNGYIDELRVTKGVARYTSNFTPPAAAFPDK